MQYPNWFEPYARPLFEKYLLPLAGQPGLRFLQIGAFTGDASLWMLRNVLTGDGSTLTDVDTWLGSDEVEHTAFDWSEVEKVYDERMRGFAARGRLNKFKGASLEFFETQTERRYDFIYIDGGHDPVIVYEDGHAALPCMKPGALLAFDDYRWTPRGGGSGPGFAVDLLRTEWDGHFTALELGPQAWFI